jgi:hypothetical protein
MAIWLGRDGGIKLERTESGPVYSYIRTDDVDPGVNRFSLDKPVHNLFITGDRLEITRVDADGKFVTDNLDFVAADAWSDNAQHPDGAWYCNVDQVGGIRLYHSWSDALAGHESKAITLVPPSADYRLRLRVLQGDNRCLARTQSWTLNTNRDVADITSLGEGFAKNQATMVSGSGDIDCFFDVIPDACNGDVGTEELSHYLHRLALRLEIGSTFTGIFIVKHANARPLLSYDERVKDRELFYKCDCVITEVGIEVNTEDEIHSEISFVTTGQIDLLFDYPAAYLLQETTPDEEKILQESEFGVLL